MSSAVNLPTTNSLADNTPEISDIELSTTKEKKSYFIVYSKVNENELGCEFTLKRDGKFSIYECKTCRRLSDRERRSGVVTAKATVTMVDNKIREIKNPTHHPECRVEFATTAIARTQKNVAVVHKSKFGGSSKQVYDTHMKVLGATCKDVTAFDIAHGYQTFEYAQSALKKASNRKCAIQQHNVIVGESDIISKPSTLIKKSIPDETPDYFLIGQNEEAKVIVLGSRFMVERFFRSKKCMSDGTFKMAPMGYKQSYMLWYVDEGQYKDEALERSKAMLAVTFVLNSKSEATYKIAFDILDAYRISLNIPEPEFDEYMTDDEPAVRNVLSKLYTSITFSLCLFHHIKNIVKCLTEHKLTNFIRKCKSDEQMWFYGKIKQILVTSLLPQEEIVPAFKSLRSSILSFIGESFSNPFEIDQFKKFFEVVEERYFSNEEKLKMTCKHEKNIRVTNLIESSHCAFNKSTIIPRHGTLSNFIEGMTVIDLQYRAQAIAFEEKGPAALPKKSKRALQQQAVITQCTQDLKEKTISVQDFLKQCAEAMIHEKYFKLVEAATERLEKSQDVDDDEADENILAIFATENSSGRVRKLCTKFFGEDWLN